MRGVLARGVAGLLVALALIAGAVLIGGAIPINAGWRQAESGQRIYVVDNGIHTDLALPAEALRGLIDPADLRDPARASASHVLVGWGDRDFYLNTPSWADLDPLRVARAMTGGGETVLHITHVSQPGPHPKVRALLLRTEEYARLLAYVRAGFVAGAAMPGYGDNDAFYPARGGYSAVRTCNQWTADALKAAGVKIGLWTPFSGGVMQWL